MDLEERPFPAAALRAQFPALTREVHGRSAVFFDGPAGSQTPQRVIDGVANYLSSCNANHGGRFATSVESDQMLDEAHAALADLVGAADPAEIVFGANMTTLAFALSRALARTWGPHDEILVTRLDHDANVSPWALAARDAGATVLHVDIRRDDCTLDLNDLRAKLSPRTKFAAIGCASNAVGTLNPVAEITEWVHAVGGLVFLDAVHLAPHALLEADRWGCDFLACSAYKFFGPHVGVLWGRRALLESLSAYKVRPAPDDLPGKWMTGTQNHEAIAGALAAVQYLADVGNLLGPEAVDQRGSLRTAMPAITAYERQLCLRLLAGLAELKSVKVWGITDPARIAERVPTVSITHRQFAPRELAERLAERGIFVWHGNFYALPLTEALGLEPEGMVRIGLLHYNTEGEVDRLLEALAEWE
ncbi:MAG TPA: cysteine desulfurase-like protein [Pirellulales bacterium]|jgi:cysteine desulfurase family protein (TIGR01976 family)|nr:cysteine desulfurase-like protein [Pirellulales bacterium]